MNMSGNNQPSTETDKWHRKMAVDSFNETWDLMDKNERTCEEDEQMLQATFASRYHWGKIGKPIHFQRGEWQISRVYSLLNRPEEAVHHAKLCLKFTKEMMDASVDNEGFADFDEAFAYEAMVRALSLKGQSEKVEQYLVLAKEAGDKIQKKEDKDWFLQNLNSIGQ